MIKDLRLSNTKISGFTLIEILIYLGLLSIILTSSLVTAYYLLNTANITETKIATNEEKNFLLSKAKLVAENITNRSYISNGTYKTYTLSLDRTTLYLQIDSDPRRPLNTEQVKVESLAVTNIGVHGVDIQMQIDGQRFEIKKIPK
jgi:type II secretory pathway pseudopilin PulG